MIKGFDDSLRIQRLGKIRLGVKKTTQGGKEYPQAVDYFVCPPEVQTVHGDKPRTLEIMLPHEDIEEVFPTALKRYGSQQGLICRGDGESAEERLEGQEDFLPRECPYKECEHYQRGHCKEVGNLQVILPKVKGMLGIYQIDTSSFNSVMNIRSGLEMLRRTVGRISLIPLILEVRMQEFNPMTAKGRMKTINPVMFLRLDNTFYEVMEMAKQGKLLQQVNMGSGSALSLDNPDIDDMPELLYPAVETEEKPPKQEPKPKEKPKPKPKSNPKPKPKESPKESSEQVPPPDFKAPWDTEEEPPEKEQPVAEGSPNIDEALHKLWDELGTPKGKRRAVLGKPDLDKDALKAQLIEEIERRKSEDNVADKFF